MDVVVGRVAKAHGIRGELTVDPRTDSPERRFALGAEVTARLQGRRDSQYSRSQPPGTTPGGCS